MRRKIILSAGRLSPSDNSFAVVSSEGLNPICGKPSIFWCLGSVGDLSAAKIVIDGENERLASYLSYSFPDLKCERVKSESILQTLLLSLQDIESDCEVSIILGDTCSDDDIDKLAPDVLLSSPNVKDSSRWCIADVLPNGGIRGFWDKCASASGEALIGVYCLSSAFLLRRSAQAALESGAKNLSDAFALYMKNRPLVARRTKYWVDLGHVSGEAEARKKFMTQSAREFNSLSVIDNLGILEKESSDVQKLRNEWCWYKSLPPEISVLAPRIFNFEDCGKFARLTMELYGYPNLSEMLLYGGASYEEWCKIIDSLFCVRKFLNSYSRALLSGRDLSRIYVEKTESRLARTRESDDFRAIMELEKISINSSEYENLPLLSGFVRSSIEDMLLKPVKSAVIHGDYCLSNILFDATHYIFKLVDPRGSFSCTGIYGDPRYDVAKLRHSIVGRYDFIVGGLFRLSQEKQGAFHMDVAELPFSGRLDSYFDSVAEQNSYNLREIKLIEALLFLTMIPLHSDVPARQMAFYLTAIKKLNELKEA